MWKALTYFFATVTILTPVAVSITRSIVHQRRERRNGIGGTQDIAMWGTLIALSSILCTGVCALACWLS